jgi:hypothetical protein
MPELIDRQAVLAEIGEFQIRFNETGDSHERVAYASAEHCMLVIKAAPAVNRWISCSDRLPEAGMPVLIYACKHRVTAYYDSCKNLFRLTENDNLYYIAEYVTHWMPLPEPPEKE